MFSGISLSMCKQNWGQYDLTITLTINLTRTKHELNTLNIPKNWPTIGIKHDGLFYFISDWKHSIVSTKDLNSLQRVQKLSSAPNMVILV